MNVRCLHAALKRKPGRRSGLTLLEVMIALAVFLVGSVGIIALFVAASVLHVDASNRRTASFIAHDLLAEVRGMRYRDVFATTTLRTDINKETANVPAERTSADAIHWAANFDRYPWNRTLHTTSSGGSMPTSRNNGIILIDNEWIWYRGFAAAPVQFVSCTRGVAGSVRAAHTAGARIFQPKTWYYVLDADLEEPPANPPPDITSVSVLGNPNSLPMPPEQGFIVLDNEWIKYTSCSGNGNRGHFTWNDSREDRG
ncbi:MAG: prepilin-type N-terminal cleavage/methylation domain-containing protein, partial [Candidatus Brocadiae bacterium]|nr:prepilin-type N-terminal cleavage/methylation domain-containing protein [Candidatus Brocadiia bacterium]